MNESNPGGPVASISDRDETLLDTFEDPGTSIGLAGNGTSQRRMNRALSSLSFEQEQVWLHGQFAPGVPLYHESLILGFRGLLDQEILKRSFDEIVRRHEILRTAVVGQAGGPVPVVAEHHPLTLAATELSGASE
jgi:hypothetical protein